MTVVRERDDQLALEAFTKFIERLRLLEQTIPFTLDGSQLSLRNDFITKTEKAFLALDNRSNDELYASLLDFTQARVTIMLELLSLEFTKIDFSDFVETAPAYLQDELLKLEVHAMLANM